MFQLHVGLIIIGTAYCLLILGHSFLRSPFRPSQYISLIMLYSFSVRPIATSYCATFLPFYLYDDYSYAIGSIIGISCLCLYTTGLMLARRSVIKPTAIDFVWLQRLSNLALIGCLVLDIAALGIYGSVFLPGQRQAGLSITAPGSQIFFALVSILTLIGTAIVVFGVTSDRVKVSLSNSAIRFLMFFSLSMIFIQRGALLSGIVLGLFMSSIYSSTFFIKNIWRSLGALVGIFVVASQGRWLISALVGHFTGTGTPDAMPAERGVGFACGIANVSSQEHDQVWPTLLHYTQLFGYDYYYNLVSSIVRPFLTSDQRSGLGYLTSVDTLNIYNNASVYLTSNFGFSISPFQYHFYSVGFLVFPIALALGLASSAVENTMARQALTARCFCS